MKIALTTGMIPKQEGKDNIGLGYYPQLGLGYLAAALKAQRHEIFLYDALPLNTSATEIAKQLLNQKPDIVAFSVITTSYQGALEIAKLIKEKENIPIIFGGPHCTYFPEKTLKEASEIDYLISGEGEIALCKLVDSISQHANFEDVPQLYFRTIQGEIKQNKQSELIQDLDIIAFPPWEIINPKLYSTKECSLLSSRGCTHSKCLFCMRTGPLYVPYRRRSAANVIEEIKYITKSTPYRKILFFDDNFALDETWISDFCNKLIENKLNIKWSCNGRADTVTEPMLKQMKKAGCFLIRYGIETGNQELLDFFQKELTLPQIKAAIKLTQKSGIRALGFFMIGLPKETPEQGKQTIQFAIDSGLDFIQMVPYKPEFNTELYKICKEEGTLLHDSANFYYSNTATPILIPQINYIPKAYHNQQAVKKILKQAYLRFYFRPKFIFGLIGMLLKGEKNLNDVVKHLRPIYQFIKIYFGKFKAK